jgi:hypothetical protein
MERADGEVVRGTADSECDAADGEGDDADSACDV